MCAAVAATCAGKAGCTSLWRALQRGLGAGFSSGHGSKVTQRASSSFATPRGVGFLRRECGLQWYRNKEELLSSSPGSVLVASSYEFTRGVQLAQARKYSSFSSHDEYWDCIQDRDNQGVLHNLHEVFSVKTPRCLYFDLDGPPSYREVHLEIVKLLREYVFWFFDGEHSGWKPDALEPVVLTSGDPSKYSAHVVFPEVQFRDYAHQREYMRVLLSALPALQAELPDGRSLPLLEQLVDCVPYSQFQLLRGPFACKLKNGLLQPDTSLEPEGYFRSDPLAYFAGHVDSDYALPFPSVDTLVSRNEKLRHYREQYMMGLSRSCSSSSGRCSFQDEFNLYQRILSMEGTVGELDLTGLSDLDQYEVALKWLHPHRSMQWWSWFRISGVTYSMLRQYQSDLVAQRRIWDAHFEWSRGYPHFDLEENVDMVQSCDGKPVSGLNLLKRLLRFDNPCLTVMDNSIRMVVPRSVSASCAGTSVADC